MMLRLQFSTTTQLLLYKYHQLVGIEYYCIPRACCPAIPSTAIFPRPFLRIVPPSPVADEADYIMTFVYLTAWARLECLTLASPTENSWSVGRCLIHYGGLRNVATPILHTFVSIIF